MTDYRTLQEVVAMQPSRDGDGVSINRLAGPHLNPLMDPFLMVDEINSDDPNAYIGGFPSHPHRGFETITYMKAGRMRHTDHMGNEGLIESGDVQWMTAGHGVIHSEMPEQQEGLLHGFQLWLNLPAAEKMQPAAYNAIGAQHMAQLELTSASLKVVAGAVTVLSKGDAHALQGPLPERSTQPVFIDVQLAANERLELGFNSANPAFVVVYKGALEGIDSLQVGFYSAGEKLSLKAGQDGASALVLSGKAIKEPIAQYGPFVMNTKQELQQAMVDYERGKFTD